MIWPRIFLFVCVGMGATGTLYLMYFLGKKDWYMVRVELSLILLSLIGITLSLLVH